MPERRFSRISGLYVSLIRPRVMCAWKRAGFSSAGVKGTRAFFYLLLYLGLPEACGLTPSQMTRGFFLDPNRPGSETFKSKALNFICCKACFILSTSVGSVLPRNFRVRCRCCADAQRHSGQLHTCCWMFRTWSSTWGSRLMHTNRRIIPTFLP